MSYEDVMAALARGKPSPVAQLAGVYTFLLYGPVRRGGQDRWGN